MHFEAPRLEALSFRAGLVDDQGLEQIGKLTSLRVLHLSSTRITSAGLEHLKGLQNLETLSLSSAFTSITKSGLDTLKELKSIRNLNLTEARLTAEQFREIQNSLPSTKVSGP